MNEYDLQEQLFERFKTLNEFSGIEFLTDENVYYVNENFTKPSDCRWFEVSFMCNEPKPVSSFGDAQDRYTGILQIDVCTPLNKGESESKAKCTWIKKLFGRGATFGDITVNSCSISSKEEQSDHLRTTVRVNWDADIDKE